MADERKPDFEQEFWNLFVAAVQYKPILDYHERILKMASETDMNGLMRCLVEMLRKTIENPIDPEKFNLATSLIERSPDIYGKTLPFPHSPLEGILAIALRTNTNTEEAMHYLTAMVEEATGDMSCNGDFCHVRALIIRSANLLRR